jgi:hypothetical protein
VRRAAKPEVGGGAACKRSVRSRQTRMFH